MDSFSTPLQVYEGSEYDSPKSMRVSRRSSQISDNSSGLSLNFHKYSIENSEESLHSNSFHGGLHRHFSLSQLSHGEPLTMDPPDDLRSVKHENDKCNVLNPIPVFTDLLGSERYYHAEESANAASSTNPLENGNKNTSQLSLSGLQHKSALTEIRKSKSCYIVNDNASGKAFGVVYTSFQNLLQATPATKSNDISVIKSELLLNAEGQHGMEYEQVEQPQAQADQCSTNNEIADTTETNTRSVVSHSGIECNPIDPEVIIQIRNHSEEEECPLDTPTSVSSERQPLIEHEDQQARSYSYTQFPAYIPGPDPHKMLAKEAGTQSRPRERFGLRHVVIGEPPSKEDKNVAPNVNLEGSEYTINFRGILEGK